MKIFLIPPPVHNVINDKYSTMGINQSSDKPGRPETATTMHQTVYLS